MSAAPASPERMLSPAPVCVPGGPRATFCWEPASDTQGGTVAGHLPPAHLEVLCFTLQPDPPSHSFKYVNKYVNNKNNPHT